MKALMKGVLESGSRSGLGGDAVGDAGYGSWDRNGGKILDRPGGSLGGGLMPSFPPS